MASPSTTLSTQRPDLATLLQFDLENSWSGFIGHELYPVQNVASQAGTFGVIPLNQILQTSDTSRAPGSGYGRDEMTFTKTTYATEEHGFEQPVDRRESKMYANYFDHLSVATIRAYDRVLRNAEIRISAMVTAISTTQAVSVAEWGGATGVPVTDVKTAKIAIRDAVGMEPNVLQVEWETFLLLQNNPQIIDNLKGQGFQDARPGAISMQAIALALNVDRVVVAGAGSMKNTANLGASSASLSPIWAVGTAALLVVATDNDTQKPCIGRTFHWAEDGSSIGGTVEQYYEERPRGDVIRVRHDVDEVTIMDACGIRITGVNS